MTTAGQCHCGAIRYQVSGEPLHHALCHCTDCRRSSGAPAVAWALFPREDVTISGETRDYASSEHARRHFCPDCGTGLFYTSEAVFPGKIDIQSATLDDPDAFPLGAQIQTAERIGWMEKAHELPQFERFPSEDG
ncbi:MAG: GFA family protein [Sphingomonadaceae bacterium]|nr:GFA family protein [Sphingomonadaceae bacterium]